MPIYEYQCNSCGAQFERWRSFSDTSLPLCPHGHDSVQRLFSVPGVVFKGSGWYVTDSRGQGQASAKPDS